MKLRYAVMALCLIVLAGIVGTPDYVLEIERENDRLRAELKHVTADLQRARLVSAECVQIDGSGLLVQVAE